MKKAFFALSILTSVVAFAATDLNTEIATQEVKPEATQETVETVAQVAAE